MRFLALLVKGMHYVLSGIYCLTKLLSLSVIVIKHSVDISMRCVVTFQFFGNLINNGNSVLQSQ